MTRSSPPQRPLKTSRTLTTLSFRYQFKFSPKERAMASSKRLQCFRSALRLKSSSLYEKKSADLEEKTKEIPLRERERERERERNTIEARKTSSHPTSLPIEVPSRDPRIRSYNEGSHVRSQKPGLTMRFQLRCQRHCTFPPRELSRVDDILPGGMPPPLLIGVPNRDPKIRSYSEVSFEASETRSCNEIPIEMSKTLYFSTMGSVQGR